MRIKREAEHYCLQTYCIQEWKEGEFKTEYSKDVQNSSIAIVYTVQNNNYFAENRKISAKIIHIFRI